MDFSATKIKYNETGYFSKIVNDYLNQDEFLKQFYVHAPTLDGIKASIAARKSFNTNRQLLVDELQQQYAGIEFTPLQQSNLKALLKNNTFTITTAHQPNIFTGPLYFIYKIFHVIKLADLLNKQITDSHFVPVYYMGSEDADLDELGYINLERKKLIWQTKQTGAVGKMKVDKALLKLIDEIYGQVGVQKFGKEITDIFKVCYAEGKTIQQATLELVNILFAGYGLLVVIPDNANLKKSFQDVVEKELAEQFSHQAVEATIQALSTQYKVQAGGRDLNLFYLIDNKRERIEKEGFRFKVSGLKLEWSKEEILNELYNHPERFSANVILRGVFQETILPNIIFVGGGGELAYWLELKNVFAAAHVPYPVLLLRNSFLIMQQQKTEQFKALGFEVKEIFKSDEQLLNELVVKQSTQQLNLIPEIRAAQIFYNELKETVAKVDITLAVHTEALQAKALKRLNELEKKIVRAEKKKFFVQKNKIAAIKQAAFPSDNLQERVDNLSAYYAKYGNKFLQMIYEISEDLDQQFVVIKLNG